MFQVGYKLRQKKVGEIVQISNFNMDDYAITVKFGFNMISTEHSSDVCDTIKVRGDSEQELRISLYEGIPVRYKDKLNILMEQGNLPQELALKNLSLIGMIDTCETTFDLELERI